MKRIALVIAIISILLVSVGAQDLKEFQEKFETFAGAMAPY